jgi:hypothetical protein
MRLTPRKKVLATVEGKSEDEVCLIVVGGLDLDT